MPQARTRLWFLPTSPRSPDKIRPELTILQKYEGQPWTREAQAQFFREIVDCGTYESAGRPPKEPDQPGRERVHRAPRALGLVRASTGTTLVITAAGHALIDGHDSADLFLHQLLKFQFPSPNHDERDYRELFRVKPFLEILRIVREVESISKYEMQAFGLTLIDYRQFDRVVADIQRFRMERARLDAGRPRREYEDAILRDRMQKVYAQDLATEGISLRERHGRPVSPAEVLATKIRNSRDYADAAMRYFQRTGLFTFTDFRSLRLIPERAPDVDQILATVSRDPEPHAGDDLERFWSALGDPELPRLPLDELAVVRRRLEVLRGDVPARVRDAVAPAPLPAAASILELKHTYSRLREQAEADARSELRTRLARQDVVDDLVEVFRQVTAREGIIDRPLTLEWNVWRAFAVLDDGDVRNNFKLDRFGNPVTIAPGNVADIECTYETFHLLVEVTLASGSRQHATEGEPVTRHIGLYQRRARDAGDRRPVFGLFVAERLEPTVIADLYAGFTTKVRAFAGGVKTIPLEIADLVALLQATRTHLKDFVASDLQRFLERASVLITESMDEGEWRESVRELADRGL
jgi:hypothetical protein